MELVPYTDENGYLVVSITTEGVTRHEKVHRLLWEFYNQREVPKGLMVRHLNDVKSDNREVNLVLGSHKDNMEDRRRNGNDPVGEKNPRRKLDDACVRDMRRRHAAGESVPSIHREYAFVSLSTVKKIVGNKSWKHLE